VPADPSHGKNQPTSLSTMVFDRDMLKAMEGALAPHIGPIAGAIIRAAARKAFTLPHLAELAGKEIEDQAARQSFLQKFAGSDDSAPGANSGRHHQPNQQSSRPASVAPSQPLSQPASAQLRFDPATIAQVEAGLAPHIGAVAKVVARRAAARARDEAELYMLAADEIEDAEAKKAFLRKAISIARKS
jgi:hypothetical protein